MIRKRVPDKFKARSMISAAEVELPYIMTIKPTKESASTIVRGIYEAFRMLGDALLAVRGKEARGMDHHTEMIKELLTLSVATKRPPQVLLTLKDTRNKINYKGYLPSVEEAIDARDIAESCFNPLLMRIKEEIEKL